MSRSSDAANSAYQPLPVNVDVDVEEPPHARAWYRWGLKKPEYYGLLLSVLINALVLLVITISTVKREPFVRWKGERPTYCEPSTLND